MSHNSIVNEIKYYEDPFNLKKKARSEYSEKEGQYEH